MPYCHALWLDSPDKAHRKRESCKRALFLPLSYLIASHFCWPLCLSFFLDSIIPILNPSFHFFSSLQLKSLRFNSPGRLALQNPTTSTLLLQVSLSLSLFLSLCVSCIFCRFLPKNENLGCLVVVDLVTFCPPIPRGYGSVKVC